MKHNKSSKQTNNQVEKPQINEALMEELMKQIKVLKEILPENIEFNAFELLRGSRVSNRRWFFVEKALEYAQQHPILLPFQTTKESLKAKSDLMHHVIGVLQELDFIQKKCDDIRGFLSIELYKDARMVYQQSKIQSQYISGIQAVYQELKKLIVSKKNTKKNNGILEKRDF